MLSRISYLILLLSLLYSCAQERSQIVVSTSLDSSAISEDRDSIENDLIAEEATIDTNIDQEKQTKPAEVIESLPKVKVSKKISEKPKGKLSPKIVFADKTFDFGRIVQGEKVTLEYTFENRGKAPLIIKNAEASCGCTQPIYPFIPIDPNSKGKILVQFNSKGRLGNQVSTIKVTSNGDPQIVTLKLVGEVITEKYDRSH